MIEGSGQPAAWKLADDGCRVHRWSPAIGRRRDMGGAATARCGKNLGRVECPGVRRWSGPSLLCRVLTLGSRTAGVTTAGTATMPFPHLGILMALTEIPH